MFFCVQIERVTSMSTQWLKKRTIVEKESTCAPMMDGLFSRIQNSSAETYARQQWEVGQKWVSSTHCKETIQLKQQLDACFEYQSSRLGGYRTMECQSESVMSALSKSFLRQNKVLFQSATIVAIS